MTLTFNHGDQGQMLSLVIIYVDACTCQNHRKYVLNCDREPLTVKIEEAVFIVGNSHHGNLA